MAKKRRRQVTSLVEALKSADEQTKERWARLVGSKPIYLYHIGKGFRTASPALAKRIDVTFDGHSIPRVSKAELRPDLWGTE